MEVGDASGDGIEYVTCCDRQHVFSARAVAGGEVVATIEARARELAYDRKSIYEYAEIMSLDVEEPYRRRGIARELLRLALSWAGRHGYQRLAVEASAKAGAPGPAFYEAARFTARSVIYDIEVPP